MTARYSFVLDFYDAPGTQRHGTTTAGSLEAAWQALEALPEVRTEDCAASILSGEPPTPPLRN